MTVATASVFSLPCAEGCLCGRWEIKKYRLYTQPLTAAGMLFCCVFAHEQVSHFDLLKW